MELEYFELVEIEEYNVNFEDFENFSYSTRRRGY
jgi:hypothetical protein